MSRVRFAGVNGKEHIGSSEFTFDVGDAPAVIEVDDAKLIFSFEDPPDGRTGTETFASADGLNIRCLNLQNPMGAGILLERLFKIDGRDVDACIVVQSIGALRRLSVTLLKRAA